ncbi:hypothetical protein [Candidatus Manganitrophus noduliformans]|uniref:Uncharacterized protein n=1 Tax=Candidatus Manganitrophus noduliformans TaxID=2606439 RepID=A0A7X6DT12_9BACT|nr:hypothetical protein [Candidatus Manganitrophus noduliformans]NKE72809.1 hypothetical protein [Candidatus Manganitrophus noduliformans]
MELIPWFPALTTTGLLAAALWLGRNLIATRLTKSVEHEFNTKLETLRAQLRDSEERLKAELRAKEAEISALRSGALSALASRQAALDKRRLEAVDQLWSSVSALAPARALAATMSVIKFETAAPLAEKDPKTRQFFEMIGAGFDPRTLDQSGAAKARPFVSPMVWAIFSAMQAVTVHSVMRWQVLKGGLGSRDFADHEAINKLIKTALPHYAEYIDKNGPSVYYYILEALDSQLIAEIQKMLTGAEADKASIVQAAEILRQSNEVLKEVKAGEGTA